jgi:hypothetical protein
MMRQTIGLIAIAALLGGCGSQAEPTTPTETVRKRGDAAPAATPEPDLAACPKAEPIDERTRTKPIPVPAAFRGLAASSMDHFAFTTLYGSIVCVDTTWLESIDEAKLSDDGRFASFNWAGYEAFGHVIVDRAGKGQVLDTGNPPVASPSGRLLAAVDLSESGFGSLNAFAVWEVRPAGIRQVAEQTEGFPSGDWRIEGWQDESCVRLSVVPLERQPEDYRDMDTAPRDPWSAAEANGWRPAPGSCPAS